MQKNNLCVFKLIEMKIKIKKTKKRKTRKDFMLVLNMFFFF